jgi:hypothetical protein
MHNETSHGNYNLMNTKLQDFSVNCGSRDASGSCQRLRLPLPRFTLVKKGTSFARARTCVCVCVCVCHVRKLSPQEAEEV